MGTKCRHLRRQWPLFKWWFIVKVTGKRLLTWPELKESKGCRPQTDKNSASRGERNGYYTHHYGTDMSDACSARTPPPKLLYGAGFEIINGGCIRFNPVGGTKRCNLIIAARQPPKEYIKRDTHGIGAGNWGDVTVRSLTSADVTVRTFVHVTPFSFSGPHYFVLCQ